MKLTSISSDKEVLEEVEELQSNQEEAHTKIMLHTLHNSKYSGASSIRTPLIRVHHYPDDISGNKL
jgi:hypothetical protein